MDKHNKNNKKTEFDLLLQKYKSNFSEKDVPPDLWYNIERELLKSKNKLNKNLLEEFYKVLFKNKISYVIYAICIILFSVIIFFQNYNKNNEKEIMKNIAINKPGNTQLSIKRENNKLLLKQSKKSIHRFNYNVIYKMEKKANEKLLSMDEYSKIFYESRLNEINNSINECNDIYLNEKNLIIKETLNKIYDKKIQLLVHILNM